MIQHTPAFWRGCVVFYLSEQHNYDKLFRLERVGIDVEECEEKRDGERTEEDAGGAEKGDASQDREKHYERVQLHAATDQLRSQKIIDKPDRKHSPQK